MSAPFTFKLPEELAAKEPAERRGIGRDRVKLMVIDSKMLTLKPFKNNISGMSLAI